MAARLHARLSGAARSLLLSGPVGDGNAALARCALDQATFGLERAEPQFSASCVCTPSQRNTILAIAVVVVGLTGLFPKFGVLLIAAIIATGYVANAVFRAWLFWVGAEAPAMPMPIDGRENKTDFPIYTVLVPLFREANVIPQLADSLRALDYPSASLDIKLVVEEGDSETFAAALAQSADGFFEVIAVPPGKPQTKPRACNYALQFARGEYLVVFDAEDKPEPDQLKKALTAFRDGPADVACLQARLNFFNARECWITSGIMAQTPQAFGTA